MKTDKSLFTLSGVIVLLVVGFGYFKAKIDAEPLVNYPKPATRPNPNGYDIYLAAAKATVRFTPEVDEINDKTSPAPKPNVAKQRYSLKRRQAWLQANAQTFALFEKALRTPTMASDQRDNFLVSNPDITVLRQLARDISVRSRTFQMENRPFEATQSTLDGIEMGCNISNEGNLINFLVANALIAISRAVLEDRNATIDKLNATQCKAAAKRLESIIENGPVLSDALEEERWGLLKATSYWLQQPGWRMASTDDDWRQRLAGVYLSKQQVIRDVNRSIDEAIAISKSPYSQRKTPIFKGRHPISQSLAELTMERPKMNEARRYVGLDLLLLRLALRAYKLENGAYPAALTSLTPKYLKTIPTDDYNDGKPYYYRLKNGNYELWSVGADGKNDNGKPLALKPGSKSRSLQVIDVFQNGDYVAGKNR